MSRLLTLTNPHLPVCQPPDSTDCSSMACRPIQGMCPLQKKRVSVSPLWLSRVRLNNRWHKETTAWFSSRLLSPSVSAFYILTNMSKMSSKRAPVSPVSIPPWLISLRMSVATAEETITIHAAVKARVFFVGSSQDHCSGRSTVDLTNKSPARIRLRNIGMFFLFCL